MEGTHMITELASLKICRVDQQSGNAGRVFML